MNKYLLFLLLVSLIFNACTPEATALTETPSPTPVTATSTEIPVTSTRTQTPSKALLPTIAVDSLQPGQHPHTFQSSSGIEVRFLLYLPKNYDPHQKWPLILFLHGRGERGTNIDLIKAQPLPKLLETQSSFPFIVVSPQVSSGDWSNYIDPVDELLTHLEATLPIDSSRLYLTGLSMGGFGVWDYALRYPDRFTAIAPIAGGYMYESGQVPKDICKLNKLPIWVFHGGADTVIEPYHSQVLVDALMACGSDVKFTLYPNAEHEIAWINAYNDPALYEWFLAHTK
jgi:predicted peptidase